MVLKNSVKVFIEKIIKVLSKQLLNFKHQFKYVFCLVLSKLKANQVTELSVLSFLYRI